MKILFLPFYSHLGALQGICRIAGSLWSFTVVEHVFRINFSWELKKNNKYSASMKKLVTLMNSLMSCIVKIESTASSKTIFSVSRDNSGKSELKLFTNKSFHFSRVNFSLEQRDDHKTFLHH